MSDIASLLPLMDEKKYQIVLAALNCFVEKGFNKTSMNDIVAASGLSKGDVYHYFASKDAVIQGVIMALMQKDAAAMTDINIDMSHIRATLNGMIDASVSRSAQQLEFAHVLLEIHIYAMKHAHFKAILANYYQQVVEQLSQLLAAGIANGEFKAETDATMVARSMVGVFDGLGLGLRLIDKTDEFQANVRHILLVMLDGISAR